MYIGPITEEAPIASPPTMRNKRSAGQLQASAHPRADAKYKAPNAARHLRRPYRSLGGPAPSDPKTVPHNALETVTPSIAGDSENVSLSAFVVPAMTAVSNPKSSPPNAPTSALRSRYKSTEAANFRIAGAVTSSPFK